MTKPTSSTQAFDADVLFNKGGWPDFIQSQEKLFSKESLTRVSDGLREEFHCGHAEGRQMPSFQRSDWSSDVLEPFTGYPIGYDLPCLISRDRPTRGRIMFCAQDPLRKEGTPGVVTIGTFFGIDSERYRHYINPGRQVKAHHPAMWDVIRACLDASYDVWLTDAVKVFAGPGNLLLKDKRGRQLCSEILADEIAQVQPVRVVALGGKAANELHKVAVKQGGIDGDRIMALPHPAYYKTKWYLEGAPRDYPSGVEGLRAAKRDFYCRALGL
ncbi:uracil-DNA glycosylase family protein [uncultured Thioclava sp.]|uniref:uracil-DNA glycosylase family protein n=1 Tax=uncultured Thioclava sp. TaxID=473858 RepID=UPI0025E38AE6|nr:uracil-DNA glycosylase family protein [uncultured Thioclava sp.]